MQNHKNPFAILLNKNSQYIGRGYIYAKKYDLGSYPGIKLDLNKKHKTDGELYLITSNSNEVFTQLDAYEDYDINNISQSLYLRKLTPVHSIPNHLTISAWVYEYAQLLP